MITRLDDALAWAQSIQHFAAISDHHRRAVSELWNTIEPLGITNALEVGTGEPPGLVVDLLRSHGIEAVGLDAKPGSDYHGDMHDLPFPDTSFDLVIARHALEHVLIPYLAIMEMMRVSRRWLLLVVPEDLPRWQFWGGHLHILPRHTWEGMFWLLRLRIARFEIGDFSQAGQTGDIEWRWLLEKGALAPISGYAWNGYYPGPYPE